MSSSWRWKSQICFPLITVSFTFIKWSWVTTQYRLNCADDCLSIMMLKIRSKLNPFYILWTSPKDYLIALHGYVYHGLILFALFLIGPTQYGVLDFSLGLAISLWRFAIFKKVPWNVEGSKGTCSVIHSYFRRTITDGASSADGSKSRGQEYEGLVKIDQQKKENGGSNQLN